MELELEALMQIPLGTNPIIESLQTVLRTPQRRSRRYAQGPWTHCTVSVGKRNNELFQALFRPSANHNETETS